MNFSTEYSKRRERAQYTVRRRKRRRGLNATELGLAAEQFVCLLILCSLTFGYSWRRWKHIHTYVHIPRYTSNKLVSCTHTRSYIHKCGSACRYKKKQANQGWSTLVSSLRSLSSSVAVQSVRIGCHVLNRCWLRRDAKGYWSVCYYHKYKELLLKHGYIFNVLSFIDNKNESRRVSVLKH